MSLKSSSRHAFPDPGSIPEFDRAMRAIVRVSKAEVQAAQAKDRGRKAKKPNPRGGPSCS
jgi:hypothetical protein